jgi:leucyl-tRNA synthetase
MGYDHLTIEARWQRHWEENRTFATERRQGHPKYYVLDMFPYPSGDGLHVGHPEGYTATDIVARYKRMQGFDVLHPMGWDAFGLPAEQHAIATGTHPRDTTAKNIGTFRRQLQSLGFSYDWSREINTTDPKYVRWTQWIFLQLFKHGLAFQSEVPVNWCPALGTVLANEEVIDGVSERGGHPVVRQPLRQWQLRITAYADRLATELEPLDWPETKLKQRDWIGRSVGAEVNFSVVGSDVVLKVFTTRPDTLFGATYMVVAPDHPLIAKIVTEEKRAEVARYGEVAARKSDLERTATSKDKTGVFTGAYAVNPVNGETIPVYTSDYVLGGYGTGAVMAVPAHDTRDFEFAKTFGLPVIQVVSPDGTLSDTLAEAYVEDGVAVRSGAFDGLRTAECKEKIVEYLSAHGAGCRQVNYKLRDWVFSRQRYWGEPIPIYFPVKTQGDPRRGDAYEIDYSQPLAVPDSELPLLLPELEDFSPGDDPQGALARALEWRFFNKDGQWFARETNTMPQWAGSCWYYLRYLDPDNEQQLCSSEAYDAWMPVDLYVGGSEHAVLHLLYARFWHKVLYDVGVVKHPEPFQKLVHQGMILGQSYRYLARLDDQGNEVESLAVDDPRVGPGSEKGSFRLKDSGEPLIARSLVKGVDWVDAKPVLPGSSTPLQIVNEKMSKSRGNVINPDDVVREHGADSLRVYEMFMGPLERTKPWQTNGINGVRGFLDRVHNIACREPSEAPMDSETSKLINRTVKKVGEDIEALHFNTAVSQMMILSNHLQGQEHPAREALQKLVLCLSPFAPHLAEELWHRLGYTTSVAHEPWPSYDPAACEDDVVEMPVQVNGKVRGRVVLAKDADEAAALAAALTDKGVQNQTSGKRVVKTVYVPGRVLNLIVK